MLDLSQVHKCRGLWVSYVLRCEGDDDAPFYIYVGVSQDAELRCLAHTGIREVEQPEFTRRHPVIDLISVRVHSNEQEALVAEVMLWNLWAGKLKDPQRVRGGRINMAGPMLHLPRGWPCEKKKPAKEENNEQGAFSTS